MRTFRLPWLIGIVLLSSVGRPSPGAQPEAMPPLESPIGAPQDERAGADTDGLVGPANDGSSPAIAADRPLHEVFLPPAKDRDPIPIAKAPPKPILERPGIDAPDPHAQWIEGYWEWDPIHQDFVWVTGTWRVPPAGRFWVNGYWKRDARGWYRVPGFWSDRQDTKNDWRMLGPPTSHPEEAIGPAPGPDYFYIPGQHVPTASGITWRPGFWSRTQPGWEWIPARWVRLSDGWAYKEGRWERLPDARATLAAPNHATSPVRNSAVVSETANPVERRDVARPPFDVLSSPREAAPSLDRGFNPNGATDLQPLPEGDPIASRGGVNPPDDGRNPGPEVSGGANDVGNQAGDSLPPGSRGPNGNGMPSPSSRAMSGQWMPLRPGTRVYIPGGPRAGYVVGPDGRLTDLAPYPPGGPPPRARGGGWGALGIMRQTLRGVLGGRR